LPRFWPGLFLEHSILYLYKAVKLCYKRSVSPRLYTTREVAKRAGISRQTLQAWIAEERVKAPAVIRAAGVRLWTDADVAEVLKVEPRNYPRGAKARRRR